MDVSQTLYSFMETKIQLEALKKFMEWSLPLEFFFLTTTFKLRTYSRRSNNYSQLQWSPVFKLLCIKLRLDVIDKLEKASTRCV